MAACIKFSAKHNIKSRVTFYELDQFQEMFALLEAGQARRGKEWLSNSINSNAFYTPRARLSILNPLVHDCLSVLKDKLLMGMEGEESRMRQIETTPPPSTGSWTGTTLTYCLVISELTKFKMKACGI